MRRFSAYRRAGMTLVELLVVVAIIGLLAATVLPTVANTTEGRRTRETARRVTSFVAQSQAKAFGQPTLTGFGLIKNTSGTSAPALDLAPARVPEAYRGDSPGATATVAISGSLAFAGAFGVGSPTYGDLIRFDGNGPWYLISVPPITSGTFCMLRSGTSDVDSMAGQTSLNTPWPAPAVPHAFEILRGPQRAGAIVSLGEGRCVDAYWSTFGQSNFAYAGANATFAGGSEIYVLFDATGGIRQVVGGSNRFSPDGPILLLVGRVDRSGQRPEITLDQADDAKGANWQYADSTWIAIDPLSGATKSAPCDAASAALSPPPAANANTQEEKDVWRLRQSQNFIRSELLMTGG